MILSKMAVIAGAAALTLSTAAYAQQGSGTSGSTMGTPSSGTMTTETVVTDPATTGSVRVAPGGYNPAGPNTTLMSNPSDAPMKRPGEEPTSNTTSPSGNSQ